MMKTIIFVLFQIVEHQGNKNRQGKTEVLREKPVPVPLCPPQIPHGLTQDQSPASEVGGWKLTTSAIPQPKLEVASSFKIT
jgi:hypothetical protein